MYYPGDPYPEPILAEHQQINSKILKKMEEEWFLAVNLLIICGRNVLDLLGK